MEQLLFRASFEETLIQCYVRSISLQQAIQNLREQHYTDPTVIRWQAVAIALLEHINSHSIPTPITYGALANRANQIIQDLYNTTALNIPLQGYGLSNILGNILGILSSMSFRAIRIFISAIVVSQTSRLPSEGFHELVFLLEGLFPDTNQLVTYQNEVFQALR